MNAYMCTCLLQSNNVDYAITLIKKEISESKLLVLQIKSISQFKIKKYGFGKFE